MMRLVLLTLLSFTMLMAADQQPATATDPVGKPVWASALGKDRYGTWADLVVKGVTQRFRLIPAGTFTMGCDSDESDLAWKALLRSNHNLKENFFVSKQHDVTLTQSFWLADSTCTQELWQGVMRYNPSYFHDDPRRPVERVTWDKCQEMIGELNRLTSGLSARLPSEAEWEYACRAGNKTAIYTGGIQYLGEYNSPELDQIAWYGGNSGIEDSKRIGCVPSSGVSSLLVLWWMEKM